MIRRPPRSTRTDTRFPYTPLFRSAHQRCDIHIPVNIGSLGEQPDHSRPLPPVKHGEGATSQLYFPAIGGPQPCKAGKQTAFPCAICSQDHCNLALTKGTANAVQNLAAAQIEA